MIAAGDRARADALMAGLVEAGALPVDAPILMEAGPLLDLYGEDIRARAFTTQDPGVGEMMLRPDFTLPVLRAHLAEGGAAARYCYQGPVFRRQEDDPSRAREYLQVGYEIFGGTDAAADDAEVFARVLAALKAWAPAPSTGDLGLVLAAIGGLDASPRRRAALRRHVARPARFRRLMARFRGQIAPSASRAALLARVKAEGASSVAASDAPELGLRTRADVEARLAALAEDAAEPPLPKAEADALDTLLAWEGVMSGAPGPLRDLAVDLPALGPAIDRLEARMDALAALGVDPAHLPFSPGRGRSAMEYYDGFTFTLSKRTRAGQPPIATGGRYDALSAALGGATVPAVGGVMRPGLLEEAP